MPLTGALGALLPRPQRLWPIAASAVAGGLMLDGGLRALHLPVASALGLSALMAGGWWLWRRGPAGAQALPPADVKGWLARLQVLEEQFTALAGDAPEAAVQATLRQQGLERLLVQLDRPGLVVGVVGLDLPQAAVQQPLAEALRSRWSLRLLWGEPLPAWQPDNVCPAVFEGCDLLLYHLHWPLSAADLRWLQALPEDLPTWLLIQGSAAAPAGGLQRDIAALTGTGSSPRVIPWNGDAAAVQACLAPLAATLDGDGASLRHGSKVRALRLEHGRRQAQLERLRRQAFSALQQRTQWLVAAGVVASPALSLDLLVLAVANGLLLRDMARLWNCPWHPEQLQAAASELARGALAFGVVDWSSQTLAGLARWHGATWLVGSAVQALSAAYLTRVVGRAMADLLARSVGVSEFDLERLKREAPLVVAAAAEAEKLDWGGFLQQGRDWLAGGGLGGQQTPA